MHFPRPRRRFFAPSTRLDIAALTAQAERLVPPTPKIVLLDGRPVVDEGALR